MYLEGATGMRSLRNPARLDVWFETLRQQLKGKPIVVVLNTVVLALFLAITLYVKLWGHGSQVVLLFSSPFDVEHPYFGALTLVGNLLLCASTAICAFTSAILSRLNPQRKPDGFITCFGMLIGIIMLDRMFRITTILKYIGSPVKLMMYGLYGILVLAFAIAFRQRLAKTPYVLPLGAALLLVVGGLIDLTPLNGIGTPAMLEEGSTLLACLNLAIYFWMICQRELFRNAKTRERLTHSAL